MRIYIGVDPGASGSIACIDDDSYWSFVKNSGTEADVCSWLVEITRDAKCFAYIERVHSMPGQGVASTFKFGQSFGFLRGLLIAHKVPFEEVSPVKWQTAMGCRTGGDKNVSKARAQQLFPNIKVTHAIADALLIAEHCRRVRSQQDRSSNADSDSGRQDAGQVHTVRGRQAEGCGDAAVGT